MGRSANDFERRLRERFTEFVSRGNEEVLPALDTLRKLRTRGWTAFLFGGIPRGVFEDGRWYRPRDLDLVFDDEHFSYFESAFEQCIQRRNNYGGLRLKIEKLSVDAWPLSATWAFREGHVVEASFERLPSTAFLNIDGVVVEAVPARGKKRRVYEAGFFKGWAERTLDINLRENPHPGICVARTLRIAKRFGFRLSQRLSEYVWSALANYSLHDLEAAQVRHYGEIEFAGDELARIRGLLEAHLSEALPAIALFSVRPDQMEFQFEQGIGSLS